MLAWRRSPVRGRLLCFDLENRPLAYWYDGQTTSEITAFGWKWDDENVVHTLMLRRGGRFDYAGHGERTLSYRSAYQFFAKEISSAAIVYGHNIRRHDLPMLNDTLVHRLKLPSLPPLNTSDTYKDLKRGGTMSVSLENLAGFYGLEGDKKRMSQADWEAANMLGNEGVVLARERVVGDVLLQAELRSVLVANRLLSTPKKWVP